MNTPNNADMGNPGPSMNFSSATRAANLKADMGLVRKYDVFQTKYLWLSRVTYLIGLASVGLGVWLWQADHGIWATVVVLAGLAVLFLGFMFGQGAGGAAYESGLLVPAVVTAMQPLTLAALADMRAADDELPLWGIIKIEVPQLPLHSATVGERVPCVALFSGENNGYWSQFEPRPLAWATADKQVIDNAMAAIGLDEWRTLARLAPSLATLPTDTIQLYEADFTPVKS
jgi:hypothetical protein